MLSNGLLRELLVSAGTTFPRQGDVSDRERGSMRRRQKVRRGIILVSFFLFPAFFYYLSPYLVVEAASKGIINGSFLIFSLLFLSSLLLGRGFCGWICPAAGCQEAIIRSREKPVTRGKFIKWLIWVPWMDAGRGP